MQKHRYITTYGVDWHTQWRDRTTTVRVREGRARTLKRLLSEASRYQAAILHGAVPFRDAYVDIVAAAILARRSLPVLLAHATWEPGSRALDRLLGRQQCELGYESPGRRGRFLSVMAIRTLDAPALHYGVLSSAELVTMPRTWRIPSNRVHFVRFCTTLLDPPLCPTGKGVFAGGNSLRDYRPLLTAAPRINAPVTVATTLPLPATDAVQGGPLRKDEYDRRALSAAVVVVPLQTGTVRSAGQQTYLNAMACGKPVVVTDAPGVRDYIEDGRTGVIVPGDDPTAVADAVNDLLAKPRLARSIGEAARARVLAEFRLEHYYDRLLAAADEIVALN